MPTGTIPPPLKCFVFVLVLLDVVVYPPFHCHRGGDDDGGGANDGGGYCGGERPATGAGGSKAALRRSFATLVSKVAAVAFLCPTTV